MNVRTQYGVMDSISECRRSEGSGSNPDIACSRIAFKTEGMQCNAKPTSSVHGVQCSI